MKCVILQPSYIPWRGYFDLMRRCDLFIFYDDVQYDKGGWRNRNRIKTARGTTWLTVPIRGNDLLTKGLKIRDIEIAWELPWASKHEEKLRESYRKAPFFDRYAPLFSAALEARPKKLADLTIDLLVAFASELGIRATRFLRSSELELQGKASDRVIDALQKVGATHYLSGPTARAYLEEEKFVRAGIDLEYIVYDYPEYDQLYPPFDPFVSVLDLLFMEGPRAPQFIFNR